MITQSRLKDLLHYDPDTGVFTWCVSKGPRRAGEIAGVVCKKGYRLIRIDGRLYYAHRLAWLYMHGVWPKDQIDHINGINDDNRIVNIRNATYLENGQNRTKKRTNNSGFMGVCWDKTRHKWLAQICVSGRNKHIGYFDAPESAHAAYLAAKAELHTFNPTMRAA